MKVDPRSDKVALHYTGNDAGEPAISGIPARDLTENDLARAVYVEHGELSGAAHDRAVAKLVEQLTAGPYRKTAPPTAAEKKAAKKAKAAKAAEASPPVEPATPEAPAAEPSAEPAEGNEP